MLLVFLPAYKDIFVTNGSDMVIDFEKIKVLLHHRFPFLMIDRVTDYEKGKSLVAIKNISGNEIHFLGHFPQMAIMPGVLIIEAMAQAGAILSIISNEIGDGKVDNAVHFLVGVDGARFLSPVVPGDRMVIRVDVIKLIGYSGIIKAEIKVEDVVVANGQLTFGGKSKGIDKG